MVWNSHQLIPNKAYSPTGASIAEAIRRYFWLRLSLHFCPSRPPVRERPANLTTYGSTYYRLSSVKLLFGLLAPSGRIRISARWYSFFTEVQNFSRFKTDISRNRNHQAYSAEGYQLSVASRQSHSFNQACEEEEFAVSALFILYIYYIIFF